jgi:hypothetical protein
MNEDDVWSHDLYEKSEQGEDTTIEFPKPGSNLSLETGTKIRVENLAFEVSEDDLKVSRTFAS